MLVSAPIQRSVKGRGAQVAADIVVFLLRAHGMSGSMPGWVDVKFGRPPRIGVFNPRGMNAVPFRNKLRVWLKIVGQWRKHTGGNQTADGILLGQYGKPACFRRWWVCVLVQRSMLKSRQYGFFRKWLELIHSNLHRSEAHPQACIERSAGLLAYCEKHLGLTKMLPS